MEKRFIFLNLRAVADLPISRQTMHCANFEQHDDVLQSHDVIGSSSQSKNSFVAINRLCYISIIR